EAVAGLAAPELVDERGGDAGSGRAERVTERDRAAVDVGDRPIEAELLLDRHVLGREGLVDLDELEVVEPEARRGERLLGSRDRADAHDLRRDAGDAPGDDARDRLQALLLGPAGVGDDERSGAVADAGRVAGGDEAVLLEDRAELREALGGGLR